MIIAIGFRVKSDQGTKFRIWANEKIKEYLVKGYNLNVERFKNNGNDSYFDELLDKIRDIRSSEKVFLRKILDIYATSKGTISHEEALKKAHKEYDKYIQNHLTQAEKDYLEIMNIELKEINNDN